MTRVIIVEDEWMAGIRLTEILATLAPDFRVIHTLESVEQCLRVLKDENTYDLLFMDIHLSDGECFDIFKSMPVTKPIIFITAFNDYALQAFKLYAVDYLLKPVKKEELSHAIQKYRELYSNMRGAGDASGMPESVDNTEKRWFIRLGQQLHIIPFTDVLYYFTALKTTFLYTKEGKRLALEIPLEQIEKSITPLPYFRINRQYIISHDAIAEMQVYSKSRVKIRLKKSNQEVIVSVERSPSFKKWIAGQ